MTQPQPYPPPYPYVVYQAPPPANGFAISGFIVGLLGMLVSPFLFFVGLPTCLIGLVLSSAGYGRPGSRGLAISGIVCSIIGAVVSTIVLVSVIILVNG